MNKTIACMQIAVILIEFLLPHFLKRYYPGYDSKKMAISILGSSSSPVCSIYSTWLIVLGILLMVSAVSYFIFIDEYSMIMAVITSCSIMIFAIGAGILAGIFRAETDDKMRTLSSRLHGVSSAIGFISLLFFPLCRGIFVLRNDEILLGAVYLAAFVLAFISFILFIMSDKECFSETLIDNEGTWERLALFFMYLPLVIDAHYALLSCISIFPDICLLQDCLHIDNHGLLSDPQ